MSVVTVLYACTLMHGLCRYCRAASAISAHKLFDELHSEQLQTDGLRVTCVVPFVHLRLGRGIRTKNTWFVSQTMSFDVSQCFLDPAVEPKVTKFGAPPLPVCSLSSELQTCAPRHGSNGSVTLSKPSNAEKRDSHLLLQHDLLPPWPLRTKCNRPIRPQVDQALCPHWLVTLCCNSITATHGTLI